MIFNKLFKFSILICSYALSPFLFILIKVAKPFVLIRITPILSNRYGHLVINPEIYLIEKKKIQKKKYLDIFYTVRYGVCNSEILKLWKKKLNIFPYYLIEPLDKILNDGRKNKIHKINYFSAKIRDLEGNLSKFSPSISLDDEQNKICVNRLKNNGINLDSAKFVCLFNRDDAYLNSGKRKKDWYYLSHHNYRINSFELAARNLSSKNVKVFRMGTKVEEEFDLGDDNIIDYANSKFKSELMDIFLASKCYFGISCGTGSSHVAILNRKPLVDLNANLHHLFTYLKNSIFLSKHYFSIKENRFLNLKEILSFKENEIRRRDQLDSLKINMIDCSQKEIADAVNEMLLRLDGNWIDNEDTIRLQKKFQSHNWKNIYGLRGHEVEFYHDKIRGKYSTNFLLNNQHWVNC